MKIEAGYLLGEDHNKEAERKLQCVHFLFINVIEFVERMCDIGLYKEISNTIA